MTAVRFGDPLFSQNRLTTWSSACVFDLTSVRACALYVSHLPMNMWIKCKSWRNRHSCLISKDEREKEQENIQRQTAREEQRVRKKGERKRVKERAREGEGECWLSKYAEHVAFANRVHRRQQGDRTSERNLIQRRSDTPILQFVANTNVFLVPNDRRSHMTECKMIKH